MPSWLPVLLVLLLVTAIVLMFLWYFGVPQSGGEAASQPKSDAIGDRDPEPEDRPQLRRSAGIVPPPALAGPARGGAPSSAGGARAAQRRAAPPPAAAAGGAKAAPQTTPARRAKPPPVQAAWSNPERAKGDKDG